MAVSPAADFESLSRSLGLACPAIVKARAESRRVLDELRSLANGLVPPDASIVFFGSLARHEWTAGSDVDWTLLVDGQADQAYRGVAAEFRRRLKEKGYNEPGPTGVFGSLSFSHDLIDCIGGERDTNTNTTRRILLLLESVAFSRVDAHQRVTRGLVDRYLDSERSFLTESGRKYKVPRFLLNDVVRYWRTLCVDYVNKQWERGSDGWALRNIKLRFSRKLMFISGLLLCFNSRLNEGPDLNGILFKDEAEAKKAVRERLMSLLGTPPLDILCRTLAAPTFSETARRILGAYEGFLLRLDKSEIRAELKKLEERNAESSRAFRELRELSHAFQEALTRLFFDDDPTLAELTRKYGVF
jgi:Nucleotidyltransferase domain